MTPLDAPLPPTASQAKTAKALGLRADHPNPPRQRPYMFTGRGEGGRPIRVWLSLRGEVLSVQGGRLTQEQISGYVELKHKVSPKLVRQGMFPVPREKWKSPLTEPCPTCGAQPGELCLTRSGARSQREHKSRRVLAKYVAVKK